MAKMERKKFMSAKTTQVVKTEDSTRIKPFLGYKENSDKNLTR